MTMEIIIAVPYVADGFTKKLSRKHVRYVMRNYMIMEAMFIVPNVDIENLFSCDTNRQYLMVGIFVLKIKKRSNK